MDYLALHLVDLKGTALSPELAASMENAYRWVLRDFPQIDSALLADWAEHLALKMHEAVSDIRSLQSYAYVALKGKARDSMRARDSHEEIVGIGQPLEALGGQVASFQPSVDQKILVEQLKRHLSERDRLILRLMLEDSSDGASLSVALGVTEASARKAVERVKDRLAAALSMSRRKHVSPRVPPLPLSRERV
jgi:DNA-directed RNA polymerase specialized sigma24 family protein